MPPPEQLDQLHKMMTLLNKGNATHDEVVELFATLSKAIKEIRENLEKQIKEMGSQSTDSQQKTVTEIKTVEARISDSVKKTGDTSNTNINELKQAFRAELGAVKALIPKAPEIPDFKGMLAKVEAKVRPIAEVTPETIRNKLEMLQGDERLENSAVKDVPKITVSVSPPENPQKLDLWVRL